MCRLSNTVIIIVNILTLIISLVILIYPIKSIFNRDGSITECQKFLHVPLLAFSLSLLTLSLLGLLGSCCKSLYWFLKINMFVMFFLIIGLSGFTFFVFLVTNKGAGEVFSGKGIFQYRLGDYSNWLQNHVVDGPKWAGIKGCLIDGKICQRLSNGSAQENASDFFQRSLSPIESGCCKPPSSCGFTYINATYWEGPITEGQDTDCSTWSNNQDILCYTCNSCKGGIVATFKNEWRHITIVNVSLILFVILISTVAGCAFRNSRHDYKRL